MRKKSDIMQWISDNHKEHDFKVFKEKSVEFQDLILESVVEGDFPLDQLLMSYRLFASVSDLEVSFMERAKFEYDKGFHITSANTSDSPFDLYFDYPRTIYFIHDVFNKAIVK